MTDYSFDPIPVIDPASGTPLRNLIGQVYAPTDTSFVTPLTVKDLTGLPMSGVAVGDLYVSVAFRVTDQKKVVWKSGGYIIPMTSTDSIIADSEQAASDAAAAASSAAASASTASTASAAASTSAQAALAAQAAAEAAVAGGGGTGGGFDEAQLDTYLGGEAQNLVVTVGTKASLDPATGKLLASQLPTVAKSHVYTGVASQAAMLALPATVDDWAFRTDLSTAYVLTALPATTLSNWVAVPSNLNLSNAPAGYTYTLVKNETTGVWPARGSSRTDIFVHWLGSGVDVPSGWLANDLRISR